MAALLVATGVAFAATLYGTGANDVINGTPDPDYINGKGGNDTISGGPGSDNFMTTVGTDSSGNALKAGLRGAGGDDKIYGESGDDDLIGNAGNDNPLDDSSPINLNDWDRAFGGTGNDTVKFVDGDFRDEVSCGENTTSTTPTSGDTDKVYIDVDGESPDTITGADTVHEFASDKTSVFCEEIKAKDKTSGKEFTVTYEQLKKVTGTTVAAVEPT